MEPKFRCDFLLSHLLVVGMAAGACPTVDQALRWAWGHKGGQDKVSVLMELSLVGGSGGERGGRGLTKLGQLGKASQNPGPQCTVALAVHCTTYTCTLK